MQRITLQKKTPVSRFGCLCLTGLQVEIIGKGSPWGYFWKGGKTAQLRSKTASSSTTLKVEVFQKAKKRLNFAPKQPLRAQLGKSRSVSGRRKTAQLRSKTASSSTSVLVVTTRSLRGHYAVTTVTTRSLRSLRGHYGHYAVTTVTTRSPRGHYAVKKSYTFEAEKTLNFAPKRPIRSRHCCRRPRRL